MQWTSLSKLDILFRYRSVLSKYQYPEPYDDNALYKMLIKYYLKSDFHENLDMYRKLFLEDLEEISKEHLAGMISEASYDLQENEESIKHQLNVLKKNNIVRELQRRAWMRLIGKESFPEYEKKEFQTAEEVQYSNKFDHETMLVTIALLLEYAPKTALILYEGKKLKISIIAKELIPLLKGLEESFTLSEPYEELFDLKTIKKNDLELQVIRKIYHACLVYISTRTVNSKFLDLPTSGVLLTHPRTYEFEKQKDERKKYYQLMLKNDKEIHKKLLQHPSWDMRSIPYSINKFSKK